MSARYRELVLQGPEGWILGFAEGYLHGRGVRVLDAAREGFHCVPLRERIADWIAGGEEIVHLVVREEDLSAVNEALQAAQQHARLRLREEHAVRGARFHFQFTVYSKSHAARIRKLFQELPEGVMLSADTAFEEQVDPTARGMKAYAPAHPYELRATGNVEGDVWGVLELHRKLRDEELVQLGRLELVRDGPARRPSRRALKR